MNQKNCPNCGANLKFVPAGVSQKTGRGYSAFWVCEKQCGFSFRSPQPKEPQGFVSAVPQTDLMRGLGLIRGDIKKLEEKMVGIGNLINALMKLLERFENEEKVVFYPKSEKPPYAEEDMPNLTKEVEPREPEEEL